MTNMYNDNDNDDTTYHSIDTAIVHIEQKQWFLNTMFCLSFVFLCLFLFIIIQYNFFSY